MLTFNMLLTEAGLDPSKVKLVRHKDERPRANPAYRGITPYSLWRASDGRFDFYQRVQKDDVFRDVTHLAAFVVTPKPAEETLFAGIWRVGGRGTVDEDLADPLDGNSIQGLNLYDLERLHALQEFEGRLVIDWGPGHRKWVQRAHRQPKKIVELRRQFQEPEYPGHMAFIGRLSEIVSVPETWKTALSSVGGVYLLVCQKTGRQYVGSAHGRGGLLARWMQYACDGHGGNQGMRLEPHREYQVSVLETAPSSASLDDVLELEGRWKAKLCSKKFGLNRN